ncbi:hypothetical protein [Paractinoplanes rishiriensis]|uniref:Uncharacterized protein n=1 Tax=Paractinoplanes rishiriensis TaxID=1050105 RepID=A0A919N293_9ACTN|nr:hypothetical protein [Actinoplanes rishiriensis]GIE98947.1 hypothetical protein Ari01nite_64120 [Actinoplanes rishiriensis]
MDDDEPMRNTAELLTEQSLRLSVYVWRGQQLQGSVWIPAEAPVGRDSVRLGALDMIREDAGQRPAADDVRYLEIDGTGWGDYTGSTYYRSNARSLRRDFANHVITLTADFGFEVLLVRIGELIPEGLYDAIVALREESVYDESDLSELESELESEDWDSWGRSDWTGHIRDRARQVDADDDVAELADDAYTDALFWDVCADGEAGYWQAETAVSGYWTDFEHAAALAWAEIERRRMAELVEWARELSAPIPGQLVLAI